MVHKVGLSLGLQTVISPSTAHQLYSVYKSPLKHGRKKLNFYLLFVIILGLHNKQRMSWILFSRSRGGYKMKTEDIRPKNEDPLKIVLKSLEMAQT